MATINGAWPDECSAKPGFADYRARFAAAVQRRDVDALMPLLANDIGSSHGGDAGKDYFRHHWALDKPDETALWSELETVIGLGCGAWGDESLAMPAYIVRLPNDVDIPSMAAVLRNTVVRSRPSDRASVVATFPIGAVVEFAQGQAFDQPWTEVIVSGRRAWVRTSDVRALLDYRAHFTHVNGEWKLKSFVAGD